MKRLFLSLTILGSAFAAHAQLLPAPGNKNPDWTLEKSEVRKEAGAPVLPAPTDRMPNAVQKSISSYGNHHYHWDADHQLVYDWLSQPGSVAPDKQVTVREQRTGTVYTFRRKPAAKELTR
jgi:hypothetical protein